MAQEKILGNQLNVADVATEVAADPSAVATLEGGIDHANIVNGGGTNSHTQIDAHITSVDAHIAQGSPPIHNTFTDVVQDTSPELGGILNVNGYEIISSAPATVTSPGGQILLNATDGGATSGNGGAIQINAGDTVGSSGTGGAVAIRGGASSSSIGGGISIQTGVGTVGGGTLQLLIGGTTSSIGRLEIKPFGSTVQSPEIRLYEASNNGVNSVSIKAPNSISATSAIWTLPEAQQTSGDPLGIDLGEYTVATLPAAGTYPNCWALATDGGSPDTRTIVRSDGTNWKIVATEGAIVVA